MSSAVQSSGSRIQYPREMWDRGVAFNGLLQKIRGNKIDSKSAERAFLNTSSLRPDTVIQFSLRLKELKAVVNELMRRLRAVQAEFERDREKTLLIRSEMELNQNFAESSSNQGLADESELNELKAALGNLSVIEGEYEEKLEEQRALMLNLNQQAREADAEKQRFIDEFLSQFHPCDNRSAILAIIEILWDC